MLLFIVINLYVLKPFSFGEQTVILSAGGSIFVQARLSLHPTPMVN